MAQARSGNGRRDAPGAATAAPPAGRGLRETALLLLGALALYLLLALVSFDPQDPGWSRSGPGPVRNAGGVAGAWFADLAYFLFGWFAYLFPVGTAAAGWALFRGRRGGGGRWLWAQRLAGLMLTLGAGTALARLYDPGGLALPEGAGGLLGTVVARALVQPFSPTGAALFLGALFLAGVTLLTGLSWIRVADAVGRAVLALGAAMAGAWGALRDRWAGRRARRQREAVQRRERKRRQRQRPPRIEPVVSRLEPSLRVEQERQVPLFEPPPDEALPPLSLLDEPEPGRRGPTSEALEALSRQVELKLADFGIQVQVVAVHPGPVITRFELEPAPGVKASRITALARDLARSLSVVSVRVVEVIPGKSVIGLEIPNEQRELVRLSELLRSKPYDQAASPLTLALGKDIGGHPVVVDLARMPHLLVAGTTGSGKSVAINAMVLSILYKATPREVRLILIDPKMLELSVYEGIPHLLAPVVTDMKEAANALSWCVAEMERRYRLMAAVGVRNLAGFNRKVREAARRGQALPDPFAPDPLASPAEGEEGGEPRSLEPLPCIVVVIDELADMMMVVGKKVEELIARLAQKARAAGIHLVLATQRPSVDVITGLIKANIPSRIAFQVSSRVDSRTILDQTGAEQLLGHGDMLYLPPGTADPVRVHGAFVSDQEVHRVADHLRARGEPEYLEEILAGEHAQEAEAGTGAGAEDAEQDPLYDEALRIVTETRRASVSGVQRRLKIGYNRAARMIEQMERAGVVGPLQPNGTREVLAPPPPPS